MQIATLAMKFFNARTGIFIILALLGISLGACSRLLPARKGSANSPQLVLDTRRGPYVSLTGCFIPAVSPAYTRIPIIFVQKIPASAVFTGVIVDVVAKNGEISLLEPVIENNQVYLKFAVPSVDSFTQYNVVVTAKYEYH
jgi:hypothetical protein